MAQSDHRLLPAERNAVLGLAGILALRMLGFYAVLPILSAYAASLPDAKPVWIGMAVGIYGFTQAIFQIPLGVLSDRRGRKLSIVLGLLIFALGSFIAAGANNILWLLIGRSVQGAGAVASVLIALAADMTRPKARTRAMSFLGLAIGLSFGTGFVVGPPAAARFGVDSLFFITGVLSVVAAIYVATLREPERDTASRPISAAQAMDVVRRKELVILNLGTLTVHLCLTCLFVVVPIQLETHVPREHLWHFYLPMILSALLLMFFAARRADHPGWARPILWSGTTCLALGCAVIGVFMGTGLPALVTGATVFTCGMALTEPILPALLTRFAPAEIRGTAAGVFNVHQFCGAFLGGILGGGSLAFGPRFLFIGLAGLLVAWTVFAFQLPNPFRVEIARRRQERATAAR